MDRAKAVAIIQKVAPWFRDWPFEIAGSYRRGKELIGDIDVVSLAPWETVNERVQKAAADGDVSIQEIGPAKVRFTIDGEQVDIRYTDERHFGSMLLYFTGSRDFDIRMRSYAKAKGLRLNEYGIVLADGKTMQTFDTEKGVFDFLGLVYTAPFLRNGRGTLRKKGRRADSAGSMMCGR